MDKKECKKSLLMDGVTIILATSNPDKIKQMSFVIKGMGINLLGTKFITIMSASKDVAEINLDAVDNAYDKAKAVYDDLEAMGQLSDPNQMYIVIGEDTAFEIDALGKQPGVFARRLQRCDKIAQLPREVYGSDYEWMNASILESLTGMKTRTAKLKSGFGAIVKFANAKFDHRCQTIFSYDIERTEKISKSKHTFSYDNLCSFEGIVLADVEDPRELVNLTPRMAGLASALIDIDRELMERL